MKIDGVQDIEHLRRIATIQQKQIELLLADLAKKSAKIDELQRSEGELQRTLAQIEKALNTRPDTDVSAEPPAPEPEPEPEQKPEPQAPQRGHGPTKQPERKHVEAICTLDEADTACPKCGGDMSPLEGEFEESEMIDVVDVEYRIVNVKRQKYVCGCGGCVETAEGPERAIEGGRYSLSFAAKVVFDKYLMHNPLARQARAMGYLGLTVTKQTLWDQTWAMSRLVMPSFEALRDYVLASEYIGLDQTSWPKLESKKSKPWQMWAVTTEDAVLHAIREDKSTATMLDLLGERPRTITCDMLSTHLSAAGDGSVLRLAGCWAHILRRFRDAAPNFPEATYPLQLIAKLYQIENAAASLEERAELRRTTSSTIVDDMKGWLERQPVLKSTSIGEAVRYTLGHWKYFTRFLEDPRIRLDNNHTERAIRGPVVGRKNHYGSKSRRGTEVAAVFYSLLETAKLHHIHPAKYLVLAARRGRRGEAVLPWEFDPAELDDP